MHSFYIRVTMETVLHSSLRFLVFPPMIKILKLLCGFRLPYVYGALRFFFKILFCTRCIFVMLCHMWMLYVQRLCLLWIKKSFLLLLRGNIVQMDVMISMSVDDRYGSRIVCFLFRIYIPHFYLWYWRFSSIYTLNILLLCLIMWYM